MYGRAIKVALYSGHRSEVIFVVAEPDRAKAMAILRAGLEENYDQFEDVGRVSEELLAALNINPGEFKLTGPTKAHSPRDPAPAG